MKVIFSLRFISCFVYTALWRSLELIVVIYNFLSLCIFFAAKVDPHKKYTSNNTNI